MKNTTLKTIVFGLSLGLVSQAQAAGNCTAMLDDLMNWAKQPVTISGFLDDKHDNKIQVSMTTNVNNVPNRNNVGVVSYTDDVNLDYSPALIFHGISLFSESLNGGGNTSFSDRQWSLLPQDIFQNGCTKDCSINGNFDPRQKSKVRVSLTKNTTDATLANVSISGWDNVAFKARCDNGHIYGFANTKTVPIRTRLYDLTFRKIDFVTLGTPK